MKSFYEIAEDGDISLSYTKYCCKEMEEAFKTDFVIFGEPEAPINTLCEFSIRRCAPTVHFGHMHFNHKIDFCPFCGERIELINDGTF